MYDLDRKGQTAGFGQGSASPGAKNRGRGNSDYEIQRLSHAKLDLNGDS